MRRAVAVLALLAALVLSGCVSPIPGDRSRPEATQTTSDCAGCPVVVPAPPTSDETRAPERMAIRGSVVDAGIVPIAGATVTILELDLAATTGPGGAFAFEGLVPTTYFLSASAPEHKSATLSVDPVTAAEPLRFQLEPLPTNLAFNETVHFRGHIQCALEAFIITPACDTILTAEGIDQEPVFNATFSAQLPVKANWRTLVADVVFDPAAQPLTDGLRVTVRGTFDSHQLGTYVDYAQFNGTGPFTFHVAPDQSYPGGSAPLPGNTTQFQLDVYPQSHGWHALCAPPGSETCFLGVGGGLDVEFDLYMTVFYVDAAPAGWTLRT